MHNARRGKSSESGGGEEIVVVVVVVVVKQNDYSRGVVNVAVAANCNVFRDAPQVQLREFSSPGFSLTPFRRFLRLFRDGGTQLLTGNFEGFYGAINLLRHA